MTSVSKSGTAQFQILENSLGVNSVLLSPHSDPHRPTMLSILSALAATLAIYVLIAFARRKPGPRPPGPKGYPLIGNVFGEISCISPTASLITTQTIRHRRRIMAMDKILRIPCSLGCVALTKLE